MNETIRYYDEHAEEYTADTRSSLMSYAYERYLFFLPKEGRILDLGCGSGRDTKFFLEKGYDVEAIDGSKQLAAIASEYTGIEVKHMTFDEIDAENAFEGIWACASLLHCTREELSSVYFKLIRALKLEGVLYMSFKLGEFEGMRNGRYFTDMTVAKLAELILPVQESMLLECWQSHDVRKERKDEMWINCIVRKIIPQ